MKLMTTVAALALIATPTFAQVAMPELDIDGDGILTQDEYNTGFTQSGSFGRFDADGDAQLSQDEYDAGLGNIGEMRGDDSTMGAFSDYDTDADGFLNEDEYNAGVFSSYDTDASGDLDEDERMVFDRDMGEGGIFNDETDA